VCMLQIKDKERYKDLAQSIGYESVELLDASTVPKSTDTDNVEQVCVFVIVLYRHCSL
jgi:hypothetical protein